MTVRTSSPYRNREKNTETQFQCHEATEPLLQNHNTSQVNETWPREKETKGNYPETKKTVNQLETIFKKPITVLSGGSAELQLQMAYSEAELKNNADFADG